MKLNNEGFAITGILYTVFVLFLMILLSVLSGLNIKRSLLEKNTENIKDSLEENCSTVNEEIDVDGFVTNYTGKYTIKVNDATNYVTYLSSDKTITIDDGVLKVQDEVLTFTGDSPDDVDSASVVEICTTDTVWEAVNE